VKSTMSKFVVLAGLLLGPLPLFAEPVNINTADEKTLAEALTGVGPALAAEIVRDREENGPYDSPEALMRVRGIGERVVENNHDDIRVDELEERDPE
jgi:competence protein ComEA